MFLVTRIDDTIVLAARLILLKCGVCVYHFTRRVTLDGILDCKGEVLSIQEKALESCKEIYEHPEHGNRSSTECCRAGA
jgi:hypothetical protein